MIYIIKVPKTQDELNNIVVGKRNIELNQENLAQANIMREKLKNIQFDYVYSSPLIRCKQFCDIVVPNNVVKFDDRIVERKFGLLETKEILNIKKLPIWKMDNINWWNCEKLIDVKRRAFSFIKEKVFIHKNKNNNILIVTHNSVICCLRAYFESKPISKNFSEYFIDEDQILTYDISKIKDKK